MANEREWKSEEQAAKEETARTEEVLSGTPRNKPAMPSSPPPSALTRPHFTSSAFAFRSTEMDVSVMAENKQMDVMDAEYDSPILIKP
jgi:hypothetical protein